MFDQIAAGEVISLADLVPFEAGRIANVDIVDNDKMKLKVKALAPETEMPVHPAPGQAIVFVLKGEGVILYEGVESSVKAGDQFHFKKGGMHALRAGSAGLAVALVVSLS